MTKLELEQALDRWGADLGRWPAGEAARARTLLHSDGECRRLMRAERQVDAFLGELQRHAPPAYLAGRIVSRAGSAGDSGPVEHLLAWFSARLWRPALFALLVAGAGFITGVTVTDPALDPELAEDVMTLAFSDLYAELEDAQP